MTIRIKRKVLGLSLKGVVTWCVLLYKLATHKLNDEMIMRREIRLLF